MQIKSLHKELIKFLIQTSIIYFVCIFTSLKSDFREYLHLYTAVVLTFLLLALILKDYTTVAEIELENNSTYISSLLNSINQFNGIRHDFNNILQTYGGYITLGDIASLKHYHNNVVGITINSGSELDLTKHLSRNPPLISLFLQKLNLAQSKNTMIRYSIRCRLDNFSIADLLLCRVMGNLIDNAIDAASESNNKIVSVTMEEKRDSKLIVILNNISENVDIDKITSMGYTTKKGHSGFGLSNVRKILGEQSGCSFHISCENNEFIVYIEIPTKKILS